MKTYVQDHLAEVAGVKPLTIRQWFHRGLITGHREHTPGPGKRYSFETCMEFAVAAELRNLFGMPLEQAFAAASAFAMSGPGEGCYGGRNPARPFGDGDTFLIVRGDKSHVVNVLPGGNLLDQAPRPMREGFIALDVLRLYFRAINVLGGDPFGDWRDQAEELRRKAEARREAYGRRGDGEA